MRAAELDRFRNRLRSFLAQLQPGLARLEDEAHRPSGGQADGELTNVPMHLGDRGTDEYLHGLNMTILESQEHVAEEAMAALERLDAGAYGKCEACGHEIPSERLEAIPYSRFCIACASARPAGWQPNLNSGRPHGPADTLAGEQMDERRERDSSAFAGGRPLEGEDNAQDSHAAGTAGGGTAIGGLGGSNVGRGDVSLSDLEEATGSSDFDAEREPHDAASPQAGRHGGAVGGTPAGKRRSGA